MRFNLKDSASGCPKVFICCLLVSVFLSLNLLPTLKAQAIINQKVYLTFGTANYHQCDTLFIQVQIATDNNFTNIVDQSGWLQCRPGSNFIYSANIPLVQESFFWRGRQKDLCAGNVSNWSPTFRFYLLLDPAKIIMGDVNGDGFLTISDIVYLANFFFKSGPPPTPAQAGDSNCDSKCSVSDLVYIINYFFKSGPPPCNPKTKP